MTKRLRLTLPDDEYREIRRAADARQMSIGDWVRQALAVARRHQPLGDVGRKLNAVREAARFDFPTAGITEIERILSSEARFAGIPETAPRR